MAKVMITVLAFVLLAGCTVTTGPPSTDILLDAGSEMRLYENEIDRYTCRDPDATLICTNQGSRITRKSCMCRFY